MQGIEKINPILMMGFINMKTFDQLQVDH